MKSFFYQILFLFFPYINDHFYSYFPQYYQTKKYSATSESYLKPWIILTFRAFTAYSPPFGSCSFFSRSLVNKSVFLGNFQTCSDCSPNKLKKVDLRNFQHYSSSLKKLTCHGERVFSPLVLETTVFSPVRFVKLQFSSGSKLDFVVSSCN